MDQKRNLRHCLATGLLVAALSGLTGCGTAPFRTASGSGKSMAAVAPKLESESTPAKTSKNPGWVLVAEEPPTFFPAGLPKDAPTNYRHGEWVKAGRRGTKWFIPRGGIGERSEASLREEALAATTRAEKVARGLEAGGEFVGKSVWTSLLLAGATAAEVADLSPDPERVRKALKTVWNH